MAPERGLGENRLEFLSVFGINYTSIFIIATMALAIPICLYLRQYLRQNSLAAQRSNVNSAAFLEYFRDQPVSPDLCLKVYLQLPRFLTITGKFPLLPTDNLAEIFQVGPDMAEIEELLGELIPACGLSCPSKEQVSKAFKQIPRIITVADLVRLLGIIDNSQKT